MKNKILSLLTLSGAMLLVASCNESPDYPVNKTGQLSLGSLGVEVENVEKVVGDHSRATYDLNPFIVTVYNDKDVQVEQWTYGEMPEIFSLPVGHYRVDVKSHEVAKAEWDRPYFAGSQEFDIVSNQITEVSKVVCRFSSLKVTVEFGEKLRQAMGDDVQVRVVANDAGELVFTPDETRAGYFEVLDGSMTLAATFTGTVLGNQEYINRVYTDVEPGQYRKIMFELKNNVVEPEEETGYIDPNGGINVDMNVTNEDIAGSTGSLEEDPIDPGTRPGGEVFSEKVTMTYDENSSVLSVAAPEGLGSLTLGVTTDNTQLASDLAAVNGANLANPGSAASALAGYGLPAESAVSGATAVDLNLSQLLAKCAEYEGTHALIFSGVDTKGESSTFRVAAAGKAVEAAIKFDSKLVFDTPLPAAEQTDGKVIIYAPAGIAHLVIRIASTNDDFAATTAALSGADLANPGDLAGTFDSFGLDNGDKVLNKPEVTFDITSFFSLLGGFPGTHTFTIEVTDNDGNTEARNIILTV